MVNEDAYLLTLQAIKEAFPNKETATFSEVARWLGVSRGDELRDTPDFPKMVLGKREVVPLRSLAVYMAKGG